MMLGAPSPDGFGEPVAASGFAAAASPAAAVVAMKSRRFSRFDMEELRAQANGPRPLAQLTAASVTLFTRGPRPLPLGLFDAPRSARYDHRSSRMTRNISIDTVRAAAKTIYSVAARTPLVRLDPVGHGVPQIYLKLERFQPIGSFKIRGAMNAVSQLPPSSLDRGVWTVSAGNAAQGVALAAREAGARASVLVMEGAPATKLKAIERLGATIVHASFDECWQAVEQHASDRMEGRLIHPFDDDAFISGNGTVALEILEDVPDVDAVVAPMGGGGLLAGIGAVLNAVKPDVQLYAAEPQNAAPLSTS